MASLNPQQLRARIEALHDLRIRLTSFLKDAKKDDARRLETYISQLRNGVFPVDADAEAIQKRILKEQDLSNAPLSFTEWMTFNTYFQLYPWKVCGKEVSTSSRDFPVTIQGDRKDVEKAIDTTLGSKTSIGLDELEALALETELNLLEL
jgi:hypothetical protein